MFSEKTKIQGKNCTLEEKNGKIECLQRVFRPFGK
jgi:hypothetical protein